MTEIALFTVEEEFDLIDQMNALGGDEDGFKEHLKTYLNDTLEDYVDALNYSKQAEAI